MKLELRKIQSAANVNWKRERERERERDGRKEKYRDAINSEDEGR